MMTLYGPPRLLKNENENVRIDGWACVVFVEED